MDDILNHVRFEPVPRRILCVIRWPVGGFRTYIRYKLPEADRCQGEVDLEVNDMASALVANLRSPVPTRETVDHDRRQVLERYDRDVLAANLEKIWARCSAD